MAPLTKRKAFTKSRCSRKNQQPTLQLGSKLAFEPLEHRLCLSFFYDFDVLAQTGQNGLTSIENAVSINDSGKVAFVAERAEGQSVFVADNGGSAPTVVSFANPSIDRSYGREVQINNNNQVAAQDRLAGNPMGTLTRIWDGNTTGSNTVIGFGFSPQTTPPSLFEDKFDAVASFVSISNDGKLAFAGLETANDGFPYIDMIIGYDPWGFPITIQVPVPDDPLDSDWEIHLSDTRVDSRDTVSNNGPDASEVTFLGTETFFRFMAADGDRVVIGSRTASTKRIVLYDITGDDTQTTIASTGAEWIDLGVRPGISDDGRAIAFYGEDADGPGISVVLNAGGMTTRARIAGVSGNGILDPGESFQDTNGNGVLDAGEVDAGPFGGFDVDSRVGVSFRTDDPSTVTVVYTAFADGSGTKGLYTSQLTLIDGSLDADAVGTPTRVVEVGDTIAGLSGSVQGLYLGDPVNNEGQIAFQLTTSSGKKAVVRANPAQAPVPFETLARGVAYGKQEEEWAKGDQVIFDGEDLGYTVDKVFDGTRGFYGLGLLSDAYGPALVIRGTDLLSALDWEANFDSRGVGYRQFTANWSKVSSWLSTLDVPADIVGHSLGGALGQWIAAAFTSAGGQIDQLVTFNSPGISRTYADRFVPANANQVTHYIVNGDLVSMAGEAFIDGGVNGEVKMASFSDWNLINKHLLPLLVPSVLDSDGNRRYRPSDVSLQSYSIDALNSGAYCHTDSDYRAWLLGADVGLKSLAVLQPCVAPLVPVPALLKRRDTTEAARQLVGRALRAIDWGKALFKWTVDATGKLVLELGERAHDLCELTTIKVDPHFSLTVDGGQPPMLRFDGGLSIDLGDAINIDLPSWLGGSFTANRLVELVGMDFGGVMDRDHLEVHGQLALLGSLLTVNGTAQLDWRRGELSVGGTLDVLDGFITASNTLRVGAALDLAVQGAAAISIPDAVPWIGGTQIASGQFLLNFVNNLDNSDDFVAAWGSIGRLELGLQVWFDGRRPNLLGAREIDALQQQGAPGVPLPADEGTSYSESYVIPPGTDWTLFVAEWEDASASAALELQLPSGTVLSETDIEADPSMTIVAELTNDRRKAVRVDAPEAGTWLVTLSDATDLGAADLAAMVQDSMPSVAVVGVSDGLLREPVQIQLEAFDADSEARIALFYDTDAQGFDGIMIADGLVESDGPVKYTWDTSGVAAGEYYVYARIIDENNPPVFAYADSPTRITDRAWVAERHVFYNNSAFDGQDSGAGIDDDVAIANDKAALLPSEIVSASNYTNYHRGINGIMVDVANLPAEVTPEAEDFRFHVGNDDTLGDWESAPTPTITVREDSGTDGADRITIVWEDGQIRNAWLQVTVLAERLGLAEDDVFYFGNAVGETGNSAADARVTVADLLLTRNNPHNFLNPAPIDSPYDFNRDGRVNATDVLLARNNQTSFLDALELIDLSSPRQSLVPADVRTEAVLSELAWIAEHEPVSPWSRPARSRNAAAETVDKLLATYWQ
ncbi:MAG TPA: hypothetical protein VMY42_03885 [Thermoguttaceae bacterium]|nr:hypothetical protein [Thermoguttaceae bacterium]